MPPPRTSDTVSTLKMPTKIVGIKSTSSAVWWIKNPTEKRNATLDPNDSVAELFRNISVHGYNKMFLPEYSVFEKLIWLVVHTTSLFVLLTVLSLIWGQYVEQHFTINLHDPLYPVENIPFPAVTICSNNRISRQAAQNYANELKNKDPQNRTAEYFLERIKAFSNFYFKYGQMSYDKTHDNFQAFLDMHSTLPNEPFFNTSRIMSKLTPTCEHFIMNCRLGGDEIECFSNTTFERTMSSYGPCCTFNIHNNYRVRSRKQQFVVPASGLTVTLNNSQKDTLSPILNSLGSMVIIHSPDEFPDTSSGGCQIVYPSYGEQSFLSLKTRIIDSLEAIRPYSPKTRNCYFDNEYKASDIVLKNIYSFTNCITRCRINSMLAICNCVPFYMPWELVDRKDGAIYCTLQHISCLMTYSFKFRNVVTQRENVPGLEREMDEALYCPDCLPSCDDIQYKVSVISLPLTSFRTSSYFNKLISQEKTQYKLVKQEVSIVHIHFHEATTQYFERVGVNAWFNAFSTVGNISSIFIGFSMVAICEIIFFLCKYMKLAIKRILQEHEKEQKKGSSLENGNVLYIRP